MDTVVVGAGISGLAYAQARVGTAADGGAAGRGPAGDILVLEAAERAGGLVHTERVALDPARHSVAGSLRFEWGPEALQDNSPEVDGLLAELGLAKRVAPPATNNRFVLLRGKLVPLPMSPPAFLGSPLLSLGGKLRALCEPWRARDGGLDGSVAQFVRHRLGEQVLSRLVDPFVSGVYAGDPELLSVRAAFPLLHEMVRDHGSLMKGLKARAKARREAAGAADGAGRAAPAKRGAPALFTTEAGIGGITDALAAALGERLELATRVVSIARERAGGRGGWRVEARRGDELRVVRAGRLVLAVPPSAVAKLLAAAEPDIARQASDMTCESVVAVIHAWKREQVRHPLDGFGYLIPGAEDRLHLGTLFSSSIEPGCCPTGVVQLRTLLGGARRPRLVDWPDGELLAEVREGVGPLLGLSGEPLFTAVLRNRGALPRYDLRQPERQDAVDARLAACGDLSLLGNWRRGISCNNLVEAARGLARAHASR